MHRIGWLSFIGGTILSGLVLGFAAYGFYKFLTYDNKKKSKTPYGVSGYDQYADKANAFSLA